MVDGCWQVAQQALFLAARGHRRRRRGAQGRIAAAKQQEVELADQEGQVACGVELQLGSQGRLQTSGRSIPGLERD
jgi:hypothetical protein